MKTPGQVRIPAARLQPLVDEYRSSGMTQKDAVAKARKELTDQIIEERQQQQPVQLAQAEGGTSSGTSSSPPTSTDGTSHASSNSSTEPTSEDKPETATAAPIDSMEAPPTIGPLSGEAREDKSQAESEQEAEKQLRKHQLEAKAAALREAAVARVEHQKERVIHDKPSSVRPAVLPKDQNERVASRAGKHTLQEGRTNAEPAAQRPRIPFPAPPLSWTEPFAAPSRADSQKGIMQQLRDLLGNGFMTTSLDDLDLEALSAPDRVCALTLLEKLVPSPVSMADQLLAQGVSEDVAEHLQSIIENSPAHRGEVQITITGSAAASSSLSEVTTLVAASPPLKPRAPDASISPDISRTSRDTTSSPSVTVDKDLYSFSPADKADALTKEFASSEPTRRDGESSATAQTSFLDFIMPMDDSVMFGDEDPAPSRPTIIPSQHPLPISRIL